MIKEELIKEARSWKGTPWVHNQACKGAGVDCIQLIIVIYKKFNLLSKNFSTGRYNKDHALHNKNSILLEKIREYCNYIPYNELEIGDILIYSYGKCESHSAIYIGEGRIIHSYLRKGVIESNLSDYKNTFKSAWRLKNGW